VLEGLAVHQVESSRSMSSNATGVSDTSIASQSSGSETFPEAAGASGAWTSGTGESVAVATADVGVGGCRVDGDVVVCSTSSKAGGGGSGFVDVARAAAFRCCWCWRSRALSRRWRDDMVPAFVVFAVVGGGMMAVVGLSGTGGTAGGARTATDISGRGGCCAVAIVGGRCWCRLLLR